MKRCRVCGSNKPLAEFYRAKETRDGHRGECKPCAQVIRRAHYEANRERAIARAQQWQREHPERVAAYREEYRNRPERKRAMRDLYYRRTYGISADEADAILEAQDHRCAICMKPAPARLASMHLDHDHDTGAIRGFLCLDCNQGLGKLRDSPDLLLRALMYLRQRQPTEDPAIAEVG